MIFSKRCKVCQIIKDNEQFPYAVGGFYNTRTICKPCFKQYRSDYSKRNRKELNKRMREYRKTPRGLLASIYVNMRNRVAGKEASPHIYQNLPLVSKYIFYRWAESRNDFRTLWIAFKQSNFIFKKTPSIDRIDPKKGYTLDNMQFLTVSQNSTKANNARWKKYREELV